ncbi:MAG: hypothetical protein FWF50_02620 [Defluviitaleaceae bacterium]|nr:hypothetical protein [Defluviitaleaceae bacterium]
MLQTYFKKAALQLAAVPIIASSFVAAPTFVRAAELERETTYRVEQERIQDAGLLDLPFLEEDIAYEYFDEVVAFNMGTVRRANHSLLHFRTSAATAAQGQINTGARFQVVGRTFNTNTGRTVRYKLLISRNFAGHNTWGGSRVWVNPRVVTHYSSLVTAVGFNYDIEFNDSFDFDSDF